MSSALVPRVGLKSAGILLTPEEFDAIDEYDENYRYELIHGVLVVSPIPSSAETGPNELLGILLWLHQQKEAKARVLDGTLPQQYVRTSDGRRLADRLIWIGLGHAPNPKKDLAAIAVEFVSAGKRNRQRDYVDKRKEYREAKIQEYWIFDRFERTMTVIRFRGKKEQVIVIEEDGHYESPLLPGFKVPVAEILAAADRQAAAEEDDEE